MSKHFPPFQSSERESELSSDNWTEVYFRAGEEYYKGATVKHNYLALSYSCVLNARSCSDKAFHLSWTIAAGIFERAVDERYPRFFQDVYHTGTKMRMRCFDRGVPRTDVGLARRRCLYPVRPSLHTVA